jgi:hypothetical protein
MQLILVDGSHVVTAQQCRVAGFLEVGLCLKRDK